MNFNDYQQAALRTSQHAGDTALLELALGLAAALATTESIERRR